jgi:RNA polymerase sigma factor (sigma-70 family)
MAGTSPALVAARESDAIAASAVKGLQAAGEHADARERYAELVGRHQRRASRIAYHYMRDAAEADEAVQDAFVKAYQHLASFREELPFDVWFTRILINGCLDRIKARTRRERWLLPMTGRAGGSGDEGGSGERDMTERVPAGGLSPEETPWTRAAARSPGVREAAGTAAKRVRAEPRRSRTSREVSVDRVGTSRRCECTCSAPSGAGRR